MKDFIAQLDGAICKLPVGEQLRLAVMMLTVKSDISLPNEAMKAGRIVHQVRRALLKAAPTVAQSTREPAYTEDDRYRMQWDRKPPNGNTVFTKLLKAVYILGQNGGGHQNFGHIAQNPIVAFPANILLNVIDVLDNRHPTALNLPVAGRATRPPVRGKKQRSVLPPGTQGLTG